MTIATSSRILLLEDEELIGEKLGEALEEAGYSVVKTTSGHTAEAFIQAVEASAGGFTFDLMILNLMRPQLNGLELCRLVRSAGNPVPILIVSERASVTDIVLSLEMGADDYLAKPFSIRELIARCRALFRRQRLGGLPQLAVLQFKDVILYPQECRVFVRGQEVSLKPKEFRLLQLFMSYPHRVWSREQLLATVWGEDFEGDSKTVDVHIRWLREKLEISPSHPEYIITVKGLGYRLG